MTTYAELATIYEARRTVYLQRVGEAAALTEALTSATNEAAAANEAAALDAAVGQLFESYHDAEHEQLRTHIEQLATRGLHAVFGPEVGSLAVELGNERGAAAVRFWLEAADGSRHGLLDAQGGGLASIVGFVLRVVVLALGAAGRRRLLVLDETFGMVSADHHNALAKLLRVLTDDAGLQVVLITHAPAQAAHADVIYRVSKPGDRTVVTRIGPEDL